VNLVPRRILVEADFLVYRNEQQMKASNTLLFSIKYKAEVWFPSGEL
jgi:hypothetical protein